MKKKVQYILLFLLGGILGFLLGFMVYRSEPKAEETISAQIEATKTDAAKQQSSSESTTQEAESESKETITEMTTETTTQDSTIELTEAVDIDEEITSELVLDDDLCVIENTSYQIPQDKLQRLQKLKLDSGKNYSFYIKDLNNGAVFSYHDTSKIFCASSIKFPYAFYVSRYISLNNSQLYEERITYTQRYVPADRGGSGIIQYEPAGSEFSIGELLDYSIRYSDNVAYSMLVDYFGRNEYGDFVSSFEAESLRLGNGAYPYITARDLGKTYEAYYKEFGQDTGAEYLWDSLTHCETGVYGVHSFDTIEFIRDILSCTVAEKYGCTPNSYNHAGIVMREQPYVMVILTENGLYNTAAQWHRELITLLDEIVIEYQNHF